MPIRSHTLWSEALLRGDRALDNTTSQKTAATKQQSADAELVPRNMHDSYSELLLPFASNPQLFEGYTNATGGIRTGMLMEHLDSLAGGIAYKHLLGPEVESLSKDIGFYVVTASVDRCVTRLPYHRYCYLIDICRLDMMAPMFPVRDVRLSGHVIHTGRSSMEVAVRMESLEKDGREETIMLGMS